MNDILNFTIPMFLLIMSSVFLGYTASDEIDSLRNKIMVEYGETPEECANLSLEKTSYCLNDYVKSIYNYTVTQD